MPGVRRKLDPSGIYECWQAFAADGVPGVVAVGTRLRGNDPIVKAHSWMFVTAGTPAHERPTELGTTEDPEPAPQPEADVRLRAAPQPISGVVELTRDITVLTGNTGENLAGGGHPGRLLAFKKGERFDPGADVVTRLPDNYFKVI